MDLPLSKLIQIGRDQFYGQDGAKRMSYLIYQLLCGVNHLHQAGIIHRVIQYKKLLSGSIGAHWGGQSPPNHRSIGIFYTRQSSHFRRKYTKIIAKN